MAASVEQTLRSFGTRGAEIIRRVERVAFLSLAETALPAADLGAIILSEGNLVLGSASRRLGRVQTREEIAYPLSHGGIPSPTETAEAVERYVGQTDFSPSSWVLAIPKNWYVARMVQLPAAVEDADIPRVLRYEIDRLTPLSPESALFDYSVLGRGEEVSVFLLAGNRGRISPYREELERREIPLAAVTPSLLGWAGTEAPGGIDEARTIVDLSPERPELLRFGGTTDMTFASLDPPETDPDSWLAGLPASPGEIKWAGYGGRAEARLRDIILPRVGPGAPIAGPLRPETLADRSSGAANALATRRLERRGGGPGFDLLRSEKAEEKRSRGLGITVFLCLLLVLLFGMGTYQPVRDARVRLDVVNEQIRALQPEVDVVQNLEKRLGSIEEEGDVLHRFKQGEPSKLLILKELSEAVPENTWFNQITVKGHAVDISGYSDTATDLLGVLERSKVLEQVEFSSPTVRDRRRDADRFKIKARMEEVPGGTS